MAAGLLALDHHLALEQHQQELAAFVLADQLACRWHLRTLQHAGQAPKGVAAQPPQSLFALPALEQLARGLGGVHRSGAQLGRPGVPAHRRCQWRLQRQQAGGQRRVHRRLGNGVGAATQAAEEGFHGSAGQLPLWGRVG